MSDEITNAEIKALMKASNEYCAMKDREINTLEDKLAEATALIAKLPGHFYNASILRDEVEAFLEADND